METLTFRRPRIVALVLLVLVSAGFSAMLSIGRQEDPTISNLFATIKTGFPGADPGRVEALVTAEIEMQLREISEIKNINSTSATAISLISIQLVDRLPDREIEQVWSRVRDAVDDASHNFPAGVLQSEFTNDGDGAYTAIVSLEAVHDQVPMTIVGRYAKALRTHLRQVPGTGRVDIFGQPEEEILVKIDPVAVAGIGLTAEAISASIRRTDSKVQAGRLQSSQNDWLINIEDDYTTLERLRRVIVKIDDQGRVTRLSDVATVTRGQRQPWSEFALQNGRPAVLVAIRIKEKQQIDAWMPNIHDALRDFGTTLPDAIEQRLVFDQNTYAITRLNEVGQNMAIGAALVVLVLFITLGAKSAVIVAVALPMVALASLATMNAIGLAIHQMSVTGMIVALGLLVDSAIVMTDEIGKRLRSGLPRRQSVRLAVRRLFAPLLASTLTTALSFLPMIMLPGAPGDFIGSVAVAVVTMLTWSFVTAVTVTPALAGLFLTQKTSPSVFEAGFTGGALSRLFETSIRYSLLHPAKSIMLALVLPLIGFVGYSTLTAQFFPGVDRDQLHIEVEMENGTSLTRTLNVARAIDTILRDHAAIASVSWVIGRSAPTFYYNVVGNRDSAPGFAQAIVTTTSPAATAALVGPLQSRLDAAHPEARILVRDLVQGPPINAPVELRLVGSDIEVLREIGDRARQIISPLDMVTIARTTANGGAPKIDIEVDDAKARLLGLDRSAIAGQLQAGLEGIVGGSLLEGTEQLPVRVRVGDAVRGSLTAISNFTIIPPRAADLVKQRQFPGVPLSSIATVSLQPAESVVTRRNGERINTIQAFLTDGILPQEALNAIHSALEVKGFELPAGYRMEVGGDADARRTTVENLLDSLAIVLTLSLAIIVLTFNSFRLTLVVFAAAGLSAGLSILCLAVFKYPFGINALIGVIGSIGVSINAAIIILTGLQNDASAGTGDRKAMTAVVMGASRHIVSTTATTVGGFLPLIIHGGAFWPPFAMAIAGGVLLSTVVSFYFVPPMFVLLSAFRNSAAKPRRNRRQPNIGNELGSGRLERQTRS